MCSPACTSCVSSECGSTAGHVIWQVPGSTSLTMAVPPNWPSRTLRSGLTMRYRLPGTGAPILWTRRYRLSRMVCVAAPMQPAPSLSTGPSLSHSSGNARFFVLQLVDEAPHETPNEEPHEVPSRSRMKDPRSPCPRGRRRSRVRLVCRRAEEREQVGDTLATAGMSTAAAHAHVNPQKRPVAGAKVGADGLDVGPSALVGRGWRWRARRRAANPTPSTAGM